MHVKDHDVVHEYPLVPGIINRLFMPVESQPLGIGFVTRAVEPAGPGGTRPVIDKQLVLWCSVNQMSRRRVREVRVVQSGQPVEGVLGTSYIGSAVPPMSSVAWHAFHVRWTDTGQQLDG